MPTAEMVAAKPEDLGIDSEKLEALYARAKRDVDDGTLKSAQVAVARHGQLAVVPGRGPPDRQQVLRPRAGRQRGCQRTRQGQEPQSHHAAFSPPNSSYAASAAAAYISEGPPPMYTHMPSISCTSARVAPSFTKALP